MANEKKEKKEILRNQVISKTEHGKVYFNISTAQLPQIARVYKKMFKKNISENEATTDEIRQMVAAPVCPDCGNAIWTLESVRAPGSGIGKSMRDAVSELTVEQKLAAVEYMKKLAAGNKK